jgi:hypothetical protein
MRRALFGKYVRYSDNDDGTVERQHHHNHHHHPSWRPPDLIQAPPVVSVAAAELDKCQKCFIGCPTCHWQRVPSFGSENGGDAQPTKGSGHWASWHPPCPRRFCMDWRMRRFRRSPWLLAFRSAPREYARKVAGAPGGSWVSRGVKGVIDCAMMTSVSGRSPADLVHRSLPNQWRSTMVPSSAARACQARQILLQVFTLGGMSRFGTFAAPSRRERPRSAHHRSLLRLLASL